MPNDTSLQGVFSYLKQEPSHDDSPTYPAVYVTFVEHHANLQPGGDSSSDLVRYANGKVTLSPDKKTLSGEFKLWRNIHETGWPGFEDSPPEPEDAFADPSKKLTVAITVSDSGKATHQMKLNGKPIGGMPPVPLDAVYDQGLFVEKSGGSVRSLSFTLGAETVS